MTATHKASMHMDFNAVLLPQIHPILSCGGPACSNEMVTCSIVLFSVEPESQIARFLSNTVMSNSMDFEMGKMVWSDACASTERTTTGSRSYCWTPIYEHSVVTEGCSLLDALVLVSFIHKLSATIKVSVGRCGNPAQTDRSPPCHINFVPYGPRQKVIDQESNIHWRIDVSANSPWMVLYGQRIIEWRD